MNFTIKNVDRIAAGVITAERAALATLHLDTQAQPNILTAMIEEYCTFIANSLIAYCQAVVI